MTEPQRENKDVLGKITDIFNDPLSDDWESDSTNIYKNKHALLERFKEKEAIASGGMKNIFKVFDTKTNRYIALAELRDDVPEEQSELFLQEAYLTAALEHPNIISVYDVGIYDDHYPFFTMELKVGDSFSEILKRHNLPTSESKYTLSKLLNIYLKVCDAVSYAHSQNILHLDIKPDNIQVGQFGEVQLCDWGLGSNLKEINNPEDEFIKGTPGFMPPEQINPKMEKSFETDIYALGALLYMILTGKPPTSGSLETVLKKTISGQIEPPKERFPNKNIPESLDAVVRKAMSKNTSDRYSDVKDLRDEVEKFLSGRSTDAENAGFIKEIKLFIGRNKSISLVTLASFLILNVGGGIALFEINKSKNQTESAFNKLKVSHARLITSQENEKQAYQKQLKLFKETMKLTFNDATMKLKNPIFFTNNSVRYTNDAINGFKKMILASGNPEAKKKLAKALIISQKFADAIPYCDDTIQGHLKLAKKFKSFQKDSDEAITNEQLLEVFRYLNQKGNGSLSTSLTERMLVYHFAKKKRQLATPDLVKEVIACWNPTWNSKGFKYTNENDTLRIRGKGLSALEMVGSDVSGQSILRFLKIERLYLSNTDFEEIIQLKGLSVGYLDISN
ncbi:MAG: serine/threonine protein kinase, partial [Lentisphaeraceae bacterium]|nr:serine/threonine protein kinase [Lentisphaeraceae bacterium]